MRKYHAELRVPGSWEKDPMKKACILFVLIALSIPTFASGPNDFAPAGPVHPHPKLLHFLGGGFVFYMGAGCTQNANAGLGLGIAAGVAKEVYDGARGHETMSSHMKDIGITSAGAAIPWAVVKAVKHYRKKRREREERELYLKYFPESASN